MNATVDSPDATAVAPAVSVVSVADVKTLVRLFAVVFIAVVLGHLAALRLEALSLFRPRYEMVLYSPSPTLPRERDTALDAYSRAGWHTVGNLGGLPIMERRVR